MRRLFLLAFLSVLLTAGTALAQASPMYVSSTPEDGDDLHQAPDQVTVQFSEPLDQSSKMIVEDHCGDRLDDKNVQISLNEMSVGIAKKPAGHYIVTYAATGVGGVTGNTNGSFTFHVHAGTECTGGTHHHGHGGHEGHEGHGGHAGHEGHAGHAGHEGHAGHAGHLGHAGHAGHAGHLDHSEHLGHEDHAAHEHHHHDPNENPLSFAEQKKRRYNEIASGESPFPPIAPDTPAVFASLGLAAAFGLLGGWVLRVANPK